MDLPDLPPGYYFHFGRNHAMSQYSYQNDHYGVQIRRRTWGGLSYVVCRKQWCDPNPVSIQHAASEIAAFLHQTLWRESQEKALAGKYVPKKHVLPDPEPWNEAVEATRPKNQKAIGRGR